MFQFGLTPHCPNLTILANNINIIGGDMRKLISILSAIVISLVSFTGIALSVDSKKPTRIPVHNWSSQVVMA